MNLRSKHEHELKGSITEINTYPKPLRVGCRAVVRTVHNTSRLNPAQSTHGAISKGKIRVSSSRFHTSSKIPLYILPDDRLFEASLFLSPIPQCPRQHQCEWGRERRDYSGQILIPPQPLRFQQAAHLCPLHPSLRYRFPITDLGFLRLHHIRIPLLDSYGFFFSDLLPVDHLPSVWFVV